MISAYGLTTPHFNHIGKAISRLVKVSGLGTGGNGAGGTSTTARLLGILEFKKAGPGLALFGLALAPVGMAPGFWSSGLLML
ncbi:hypothetical protein AMTR_s00180p00023140 [Amborella trichopoda]|uniref:Uncharacterized protein n=1 Tax=Amborella trichopoda TaxID=13333 RepID=W1PS27_AMBTC|nr:hypothetical protein AMTR_s00180p00023140 [Amborella trichopoda]